MAHDHSHDHDHEGHDHSDCGHDHGGDAVAAVLEDIGPCKKLLKVTVPPEEVSKAVDERIRHLSRTVHLKGFRPGKAPRKRIEKIYGKAVRDDTRDQLLRESFSKAIDQEIGESKVLGEGTIENVDFSEESGLQFEVTVHTRPEFDLGDYKALEIDIEKVQIEEKEVEGALDRFRASKGEVRPVEGDEAVVEGEDQVLLDVQVWLADEYEAFAEAEEEGGETTQKPLKTETGIAVQLPLDRLGNYPVVDLADSLTGLKIGQWGEVESDLPVDFDVVEGRGEPAVLRVQVKSIKRLFLPELTEEMAKEAGHDSINDLRREIREELQQRLDYARRGAVEEALVAKLLQTIGDFDLPADMLAQEIKQATQRKAFELQYMEKLSAEEAQAKVREDEDELATEVEEALRTFFVLDEIARAEEIRVSESDVSVRLSLMAAQRGQDPAALRAELEKHKVLPQVYHDILDEKTRGFLREHATVNEIDPDA